jgi:hypothetical protein
LIFSDEDAAGEHDAKKDVAADPLCWYYSIGCFRSGIAAFRLSLASTGGGWDSRQLCYLTLLFTVAVRKKV